MVWRAEEEGQRKAQRRMHKHCTCTVAAHKSLCRESGSNDNEQNSIHKAGEMSRDHIQPTAHGLQAPGFAQGVLARIRLSPPLKVKLPRQTLRADRKLATLHMSSTEGAPQEQDGITTTRQRNATIWKGMHADVP